ncbi:MAG: hypothetical protein JOY67_09060 [Hyphomicrobiales bacterium]|nr:hypothetical protein [Hyphomicrobiales bacterium]MBV9112958.1 hypothetical protein [Hyphomicrobiales bacterium]MBV9520852.1 hypothetical protein [Hyphomicrobiales bacterium]
MRKTVIFSAGVLISAGLLSYQPLSSATIQGPRQALISATDGYGVSECLTSGEDCGRLVAQSWCRSNGYDRLVAIRPTAAEDVPTASETIVTNENGSSVVISCERKKARSL